MIEYDQTPVLFWMGANYRYMAPELQIIDGLTPFAETTLGVAFAQGPVGEQRLDCNINHLDLFILH